MITGKEIVRHWIETQTGKEIDYLKLQTDCVLFGRTTYGVYHTPESYTRYFRMVRDELDLLEVPGKWKTWQVIGKEQTELAL